MFKSLLIPILVSIPLIIIQLTVIPFISVYGVAPDVVVILIIITTLKYGQLNGTIVGFVIGILFDLFSGGLLGSAMFSKTAIGFLTGFFYKDELAEQTTINLSTLPIILLIASIDSFLHSFLAQTETNITIGFLIFEQGLFPGLYTMVIAFPLTILKNRKAF